jgi:hypothetical protein
MRCKATPLKKIREHCLGCCGDSPKEVKYCPCADCPIWPFRFGKTPKAVMRQWGDKGRDLLDETCFIGGGKFDPSKPVAEMES